MISAEIQRVREQSSELLVEDGNLLSLVFKNAVGSRRAAWRVITSTEQEEKFKGKEQLASHAREYVAKVEGELQKIRDGILALMDENLIRLACTDESKVFYYRMKSDYYRHLAEFATGETKGKDVEDLEADTMKHSSIPETAVSGSTLDGEVSGRDRISQCTVEQILDVPVHERVEHSAEMPKIVSQDEIQQRTVKQIADIPVPQAVEELAEVFKVYSRDEVHKRFVEQTIETPSTSIAEMIVEVPVIQTPSVQHVVDTVEVEKLKIIEHTVQKPVIQEKINQVLDLTVQRKKPIIQEKINQETEHIELDKAGVMLVGVQRQMSMAQTVEETMKVQPLQFIDKVVDVPVVAQRQIPIVVQTVQKATVIPQSQCIDKVIDVPVVSVTQAPHVQIVEKTVENPQMQIAEKTAEIPLLQIVKKTVETPEVQTVRGTQTSESLGTASF